MTAPTRAGTWRTTRATGSTTLPRRTSTPVAHRLVGLAALPSRNTVARRFPLHCRGRGPTGLWHMPLPCAARAWLLVLPWRSWLLAVPPGSIPCEPPLATRRVPCVPVRHADRYSTRLPPPPPPCTPACRCEPAAAHRCAAQRGHDAAAGTRSMECVLFKGLVGSNLMQRLEAEDVGTTSYSLKLRQSAAPTADAIFRQCDTTSTSTYTTSTVTSSTSVTSTTQTTSVCETDTLTTMASIPAGYDLVHLGSLDPTYNIRFKKDIVSTLYQGKKDTLEECAHECTKLVGGVNSCEVHTSRGACFQEPGCFFDGGIGKSGGCRSARCEDHDTNPDACKKAASSGCSYAGGLCQSSKGDSDGARCLTTPTAECTSNATAGMHCERKDDRCDCQRGNSGDCISNEHRVTKRQQMACEGFSYDICSSSCLVVSKVLSESQAGPSPDTVEAAGSPTLSFANSRVAPAPFRSADCRLFTHAHEACGVGAYCAKGGKCARCGGTSGAACGGNGNTHDNGPCPAKCYGAELALAEGESWPAGLDQAAAAGAPQPRSTAEKCQIGGHKFLKKALENFVTFADGGDIGASTFTNRMDTALERLALRVKTTAPQRHLVVHRKGGSALYGEGRAADITMHSTDATVNSTDAELLVSKAQATGSLPFTQPRCLPRRPVTAPRY